MGRTDAGSPRGIDQSVVRKVEVRSGRPMGASWGSDADTKG